MDAGSAWAIPWERTGISDELAVAVEAFEYILSGEDTVVLGFFEDGNAAQIGIGEEDASGGAWVSVRKVAALFGEDGADGGAGHGVAHAHDVDARDALADVGVDALEIVEDGFLPVSPIFFEEELAVLRGGSVGQRPIKGPDSAVDVGAEGLVCGVDVAEGGRVEKDGVPSGLGAAGIGETFES